MTKYRLFLLWYWTSSMQFPEFISSLPKMIFFAFATYSEGICSLYFYWCFVNSILQIHFFIKSIFKMNSSLMSVTNDVWYDLILSSWSPISTLNFCEFSAGFCAWYSCLRYWSLNIRTKLVTKIHKYPDKKWVSFALVSRQILAGLLLTLWSFHH